jgi:uncharacterized damage-inducible protein DinB
VVQPFGILENRANRTAMKNDLLDLIRYNDWANERMMEAIRSVSEESRRAPTHSLCW